MASTPTDPPSLIHPIRTLLEPIRPEALFAEPGPLELELGSGDGSFILNHAAAHPERRFLAVERLLGRLKKIDRQGRRRGLRNLRCLRIEAAYFLKYLVPPGSLEALHVYFPDPWPKRKHRKNRLINAEFPGLAARVLAPEGRVYLRTDHAEYHAQMREVFEADARFSPIPTPPELAARVTDFEREFHRQGIPTLHAAYVLKPGGGMDRPGGLC